MTLDSTTSNAASTYTESNPQVITYDDLIPHDSFDDGNSYSAARLHVSDNTSYGVYYNFAAASAMTITGESNRNDATYDICPKSWRLPTEGEQGTVVGGDYVSAWLPVYSGDYISGSITNESTKGYWWSSTASTSIVSLLNKGKYRSVVTYTDGSLSLNTDGMGRVDGLSIRCIRAG